MFHHGTHAIQLARPAKDSAKAAQVSLLEGELLRDVSIGKNFDATAIQDRQALH